MNDQATKLRSIIDQRMKLNSEPRESTELEQDSVFVSDIMMESKTIYKDGQLRLEGQTDDINHEVPEQYSPLEGELNTSEVYLEQNPESILEKQREIGVLAIASNHLMSTSVSFVLNVGIQLQSLGKNVCIIDVDGSLFNYLNQDNHEGATLTDVINQRKPLSEVMINGPQQVKLIKSGDFIFNTPLTEELLRKQLEPLSDIDFILINTDTNLSRATMISFILAQELVLISMPDVSGIKDTYSLLKIINNYEVKSIVRVLFERVPNVQAAQKGFKLLMELKEHFLDLNISSLGYVNSKVSVSSSSEQLQSHEEIRFLANNLQQLPLLGGQPTTIQEVIHKLIQLCS